MNVSRFGHGVVVLNDELYAIGGEDKGSKLNSVEKYNVKQNAWKEVASMEVARSNFGCVVAGGMIYVFGDDGENYVERYCPKKNKWEFWCNMDLPGVLTQVIACAV